MHTTHVTSMLIMLVMTKCSCVCAGDAGIPGGCGGSEDLSEGCECGASREPGGSDTRGDVWQICIVAMHGLWHGSLNIVIHILNEGLYFVFMLFAQLCDTQDEVNQTLAGGVLDSGIQASLYVFHAYIQS